MIQLVRTNMKTIFRLFATSCALLLAVTAEARVITLNAYGTNNAGVGFAEVFIESYEVGEVISFPVAMNVNSSIEVIKDGRKSVLQTLSVPNQGFDPVVVAGPAVIRLVVAGNTANNAGLCTVRITPEAYPPDKSILVAPGSGGAVITLECSTNLLNWTSTTNGVYTNLPAAKFFRIREERIKGE